MTVTKIIISGTNPCDLETWTSECEAGLASEGSTECISRGQVRRVLLLNGAVGGTTESASLWF